ncbi:LysR family transcriptional regulator [Staphylococcus pettenkoferi]|uniref:LysR family transcriptional regulator n=1 Tax=Staphylococcus pettenkoferi TaxID=170573 RepID=A0ABT4BHG7_9STAP|nr:LysR family transcriptional regulator [Staphylococcus pettenkoferi]MCY1563551.1 LysR family transcriptional regulator [Staphylococcus pettenkoferi]MCY1571721.1 LysR family transcriptional regulator [Staphylococcus pettenkoferi]MCY1582121.1 LysR family transcriptional regulator [Staphylococcus pettenkoferi]MCY1606344.1 LysR family transcriptional regulator [Staphylococcus pettenkoferi]MDH9616892.1 LysR family transcriptional regulator [Staphylococcus pettenkoferi]
MHLDYIADLRKVAELQSMNKAAQCLNISTPALSKRIKSVEDYFECKLFYRTSKGIFLTEAGEKVLRKLVNIHKEMRNLKRDISEKTTAKVRVGVLPSYFLYQLEDTSSRVLEKDLTINVESTTQILLSRLYETKIDALIGDIESVKENDLYYKTLYSEGYNLICSKNLSESFNGDVEVEEINESTLFVLNPPCDTLNFIRDNLNVSNVNLEYKDNLDSILADVRMEKGYTILPDSLRFKADKLNLDYVKIKYKQRDVGIVSYNECMVQSVYDILSRNLKEE